MVKLISLFFLCLVGLIPAILAINEGTPHFEQYAFSSFDNYTSNDQYAEFMNEHYYRMMVFSPYFSSRTKWYANGWLYHDSYAIKDGSNPDWILKDANGTWLYIPFACSGGTCPQYAADFGNQDFRNAWISQTITMLSKGDYKGLWIDDVNLAWRVSDGTGAYVNPIDPRTGVGMTFEDWQMYFVEFLEQIRQQFSTYEIAHNALWFVDPTITNEYVLRQVKACDYFLMQRGVVDNGITPFGSGFYGIDSVIGFVETLHSLGRNIGYHSEATTEQQSLLQLAFYFLTSNGGDTFGSYYSTTPSDWWPAYDTNLGDALGSWYRINETGLLRRDFTGGVAVVAPPGVNASISFGSKYQNADGLVASVFQLTERSGLVLQASNVVNHAKLLTPSLLWPSLFLLYICLAVFLLE